MNYHLHQHGQDAGIFPLEELRRRRDAGELRGNELIWCEGMPDWQTLDSILNPGHPPALPAFIPAPAPQKKPSSAPVGIILSAVFGIVFLAVIYEAVVIRNFIKQSPVFNAKNSNWSKGSTGSAAYKAASKPVITTSNTLATARWGPVRDEFRKRQYLEAYKQNADHSSPTYATGLEFIEAWIAKNDTTTVHTNLPDVTALADKLATNPQCTDPIVLTIAGIEGIENFEAIRRLERAMAGFEKSSYKAYPRFYAAVTLAGKYGSDSPQRKTTDAAAVKALHEAFTDGSFLPKDQPEIGDKLIYGWASGFFDRNCGAVYALPKAAGKEFEWLSLALEGEYHINEAWRARGGGYANTVNDSGWKGFKDHLAEARKCYTAASEMNPEMPLAASRMIYVSLGDSDITEMRRWFDRAVEAEIDYPHPWAHMRWGLRPRWYGDYESMLAFGVTALNTGRFDTDAPRNLFSSISDLEAEYDLERGEHIYGHDDIWPHLQKMYEGYIAEPSQASVREGWRNTFTAVSFLAGKYEIARQQLETNQWKIEHWNRAGWSRDLSLLPLEVAARTGSLSNLVDKAESDAADGKIDAALKTYAGLPTATIADERTRQFIRQRAATLTTEQKLEAGDWVEFLPADDTFMGWNVERGNFKRLSDGSLEVQSGPSGHAIYSRAKLGSDFEIKGAFEVVSNSNNAFQAGLVMGLPELESTGWYSFRIKRNNDEGEVATFAREWRQTRMTNPLRLNDRTNSFQLKFQSGYVSASVNGTDIFKNVRAPRDSNISTNQDFLAGLGAFNDMNNTVIRYRDLQARKLSQ
jgi:hypothetical protein